MTGVSLSHKFGLKFVLRQFHIREYIMNIF